jgi:hypothetical protein
MSSELLLYTTEDGTARIDVRLVDETVWLTQAQMGLLFDKDKRTISEHIQNIFEEREADEHSVVRKFRTTGADGKNYDVQHYSLDMIISVGYPLVWETLEGRSMCKIRYYLNNGGYRSPQEQWPVIQDKIIEAMNRLEQTLKPYLSRLNLTAEETP